MKSRTRIFSLHKVALAVQGCLALVGAANAAAGDPTLASLVEPYSTVEIGAAVNHGNRAKASEYSGIEQRLVPLGSFSLAGGGRYDSDDARRWSMSGLDLGTRSNSLAGDLSDQGVWRLRMNADQLSTRGSDSYLTPYTMTQPGVFRLPSTWVIPTVPKVSATTANARGLSPDVTASSTIVGGVLTAPTSAQLTTAANTQAADLALFHAEQLRQVRQSIGLSGEVQLGQGWRTSVSGSHEHKQGNRILSAVTRLTGGDISTPLAQPIDQDHDQYHLGADYARDGAALRLSYDASLFHNTLSSVTWSPWSDPSKTQSMGTAPSNQFHKLSAAGTYEFSPATKLTTGLGYSRSTQNEKYLNDGLTVVTPLPQESLNGLVVSEDALVKLSHAISKQWQVTAAYHHDSRDNRTQIKTYGFYDVGELASATPSIWGSQYGSNINLNANRPYSKRQNDWSAESRYRLSNMQEITASWQTQATEKYCTNSWYNCSDATESRENTLKASWHSNPMEELSARVGVLSAKRQVKYDENAFLALVPMANVSPSSLPATVAAGTTAFSTLQALGLTGYGPVSGLTPAAAAGSALAFFFPLNNALSNSLYANGNRISELIGMRRYNNANRDRSKVDGSLQWMATEALVLQANMSFARDGYAESVYGLQNSRSTSLQLEANYAASDELNIAVYGGRDAQSSRSASNSYTTNTAPTTAAQIAAGALAVSGGCFNNMTVTTRNASNKVDPCLNWSAENHDQVDSLGLTLSRKNLLAGHLDIDTNLHYSRARSRIDVQGGNYVANPYAGSAAAGAVDPTIGAYYIAASALPDTKTESTSLSVAGRYRLSEGKAVRAGVSYTRMRAVDWAYEGLQPNSLSGVLPTFEQAPSYKVYGLALSYEMTFR